MATAQSVKAPKKAPKRTRDPLLADEKYTGREPVWDTERALKMDQAEFDHHLRRSLFYYNYFFGLFLTKLFCFYYNAIKFLLIN
jgi:hypothetical protein